MPGMTEDAIRRATSTKSHWPGKMINSDSDTNITVLVSKVLECIPSHRETPKAIEEIAVAADDGNHVSRDVLIGIVASTVTFLDTLGVLKWQGRSCQTVAQIPTYFRNSLSWYFTNHQRLFSNWEHSGVGGEIKAEDLLDKAPYFLMLAERRRLTLSKEFSLEPGCSRLETVAFDIVTTTDGAAHYFLHQWDQRAEQYQLIGGRRKSDEAHYETAKRELQEELSRNELVYKRDFELSLLRDKPIEVCDVSRTYGALTSYEFWLYAVTFKLKQLKLSEGDKWVTLDDMRIGTTKTGKRIGDAALYRLIDNSLPGGLENLPFSIDIEQVEDFLSFV